MHDAKTLIAIIVILVGIIIAIIVLVVYFVGVKATSIPKSAIDF